MQLLVRAAADDPATFDVHHLVGQRDGRHPVGDDDDRAAVARLAQSGEDAPASTCGSTAEVASSRTSSRGRPDERAGQRQPLPLPAGQVVPALPHPGVEAVRQRGDEVRRRGPARARAGPPRRRRPRPERDVRRARCRRRRRCPAARAPRARPARRGAASRRSTPSSRTCPSAGSTSRTSRPASVDLPEPVGPTTATVLPAATSSVTSCSTGNRSPSAALVGVADAVQLERGRAPPAPARARRTLISPRAARTADDPVVADDRPRQLAEHPADRAHRERRAG